MLPDHTKNLTDILLDGMRTFRTEQSPVCAVKRFIWEECMALADTYD